MGLSLSRLLWHVRVSSGFCNSHLFNLRVTATSSWWPGTVSFSQLVDYPAHQSLTWHVITVYFEPFNSNWTWGFCLLDTMHSRNPVVIWASSDILLFEREGSPKQHGQTMLLVYKFKSFHNNLLPKLYYRYLGSGQESQNLLGNRIGQPETSGIHRREEAEAP